MSFYLDFKKILIDFENSVESYQLHYLAKGWTTSRGKKKIKLSLLNLEKYPDFKSMYFFADTIKGVVSKALTWLLMKNIVNEGDLQYYSLNKYNTFRNHERNKQQQQTDKQY